MKNSPRFFGVDSSVGGEGKGTWAKALASIRTKTGDYEEPPYGDLRNSSSLFGILSARFVMDLFYIFCQNFYGNFSEKKHCLLLL